MCGIFAVFGSDNASYEIKRGLDALQHRGQNGVGIYTYGEESNAFYSLKGPGLVSNLFHSHSILDKLEGNYGIGHVRYPTIGRSNSKLEESENAQPFRSRVRPRLVLAHNGNLINSLSLANELNEKYNRRVIKSNCDGEVITNVLADSLEPNVDEYDPQYVFDAIEDSFQKLEGSYSCVAIIENVGLIAFKDPYGIRPLVMGHRESDGSYAFASEVSAFKPLDYKTIRHLKGGEAIVLSFDYSRPLVRALTDLTNRPCFFEAVYFSDVTSTSMALPIDGIRIKHGQLLAERIKADSRIDLEKIDFVAPIPDGGNALTVGLEQVLGKPHGNALRKSKYVGRSFIANTQKTRINKINSKFDTIDFEVEGSRFILADDSIVRGNTTREILKMLWGAGAEEIHIAIGNAPTKYICQLGIDIPEPCELIANTVGGETFDEITEEIRKSIGATTLTYLTVDDVAKGFNRSPNEMCMGCISGKYPIEPKTSFTKRRNSERLNTKEY